MPRCFRIFACLIFSAILSIAAPAANAASVDVDAHVFYTINDVGTDGTGDFLYTANNSFNSNLGWVKYSGTLVSVSGVVRPSNRVSSFTEFLVPIQQSTIVSAILEFTTDVISVNYFSKRINVSGFNGDGVSSLSDFGTVDTFIGSVFNPELVGLSLLTIDVTQFILNGLATYDYFGFRFDTNFNSQLFLRPDVYHPNSNLPILRLITQEFTAVPLPSTLYHLLTCLLALYVMTRRRVYP